MSIFDDIKESVENYFNEKQPNITNLQNGKNINLE